MIDSRRFRSVYAAVLMFTVLAGDAWRYTISWYGFGVVVAALIAASLALLVRERERWTVRTLPLPLLLFLGLATASIAWSFYPGASALGVAAQLATTTVALAATVTLSWEEVLTALGRALRAVIGLSIVFELVVALIIRHPVLPLWVDYGTDKPALMLLWSRNVLLTGDRIQGIVGNSSTLAFLALLALIVFAIELASGRIRRAWGAIWIALAILTVALTRSATITIAIVAAVIVVAAVLLVRQAESRRGRALVYAGIAAALAIAGALGFVFRSAALGLLGKSEDLTGRLEIWNTVIGLAVQRPIFGWGWVSYWAPWVEPFNDLVIRNGVVQLHAHNAWIDVWLQLGFAGVAVLAVLVITAFGRSWQFATDRRLQAPDAPRGYTALSLLPLLLLVALIVQSAAESRLLVEYGWLLLVLVAAKTKRGEPA